MSQLNRPGFNSGPSGFGAKHPVSYHKSPHSARSGDLNLASISMSQQESEEQGLLSRFTGGRLANQLAKIDTQGRLLTIQEASRQSSFFSTLARTIPREEELETYNLLKETSELFINTVSVADLFVNRNYLDGLTGNPLVVLNDARHTNSRIQIREITKFVYDDENDIVDYMTNVYAALHNANSTVMLILQGTETGVSMYLGLMKEGYAENNVSQAEYLLNDTFTGNFPGSSLGKRLTDEQIEKLMQYFTDNTGKTAAPSVACVTAVPSPRQNGDETRFQNISQFIDTMRGQNYTCMLVASPVNSLALTKRIQGYESLYTSLAPYANISIQHGINASDSTQIGSSKSFSTNVSHAISISNSVSDGESGSSSSSSGFSENGFNESSSYTNGWNHTTSHSRGHTETNGYGETVNHQTGRTYTNGTNRNITVNFANKHISDLLEQTEQHIKRLKESRNFGLWECAAYFLSKDSHVALNAACAYKSLLVGDQGCMEKAYINLWDEKQTELQTLGVLDYLQHGMHPLCQLNLLAGQYREIVNPATFISGKDLPLFMGMPNKSVCGLPVVRMASFGRNIVPLKLDVPKKPRHDVAKPLKLFSGKKREAEAAEPVSESKPPVTIHLGKIFHRGRAEETDVHLNTKDLSKHCFVTGSTGSGKSNTMYCLLNALHEKGISFMVVEPAKGEYKTQFGGLKGINVFTAQPNVNRLLKINPFKFPDKIHILEHMDRLLEIFKACWEMSQAMPALLKKAVETAYLQKGWDMVTSTNITTDREFEKYPTFQDLLTILRQIIETSDYSNEAKGNYTGALVSRVESLTNGVVGQMLCSPYDVDDSVLFDENCIIDLSRIGSSETKSLLMGLLVMRLNEYRVATSQEANLDLRHVTVLEEAHNLLPGSTGSSAGSTLKEKSVEMLSNSIAEMRTYGEAFIIVDQSPSAVSSAAIKNTNTKIILRLPAAEDAEAVGRSVGLNDDQIHEIAKLPVGVAVTMQSNWQEAVLVLINHAKENAHPAAIHDDAVLRKMKTCIAEWVYMYWACSAEQLAPHWAELLSEIEQLPLPPDFIKDMRARINCLKEGWDETTVRRMNFIYCLDMDGIANVIGNTIYQRRVSAAEISAKNSIKNSENADNTSTGSKQKPNPAAKPKPAKIGTLEKFSKSLVRHYLECNTDSYLIFRLCVTLVQYYVEQLMRKQQMKEAGLVSEALKTWYNNIRQIRDKYTKLLDLNAEEKSEDKEEEISSLLDERYIEKLTKTKDTRENTSLGKKWQSSQHEAERCSIIVEAMGLQRMAVRIVKKIQTCIKTSRAQSDEDILRAVSGICPELADSLLFIKSELKDDRRRRSFRLLYIMVLFYTNGNTHTHTPLLDKLKKIACLFKAKAAAAKVKPADTKS